VFQNQCVWQYINKRKKGGGERERERGKKFDVELKRQLAA
jgi:hypothetical protein